MNSQCFIDAFTKENGKIFWGDQYTFNCLRAAAEDKTDEELVAIMLAQKEKKETPKKISSDPHVNMMGAKRAQYKAIRSKYQDPECDECVEELTQAGWKPTKPISKEAKERAKTYKKIKAKYEDTSCDECVKELTEAGWKPKKAPKSDDEKEKELRAQLHELEAKKAHSDTEEKGDDSDTELKKETFEDSDDEKHNDSDEEKSKPEEKPKSEDKTKKVKLSAEEKEAKKAEKEAKKAEKDAKKAEKDAKKAEKDAKKVKKAEKDTKASESSDEE
jgi:hypothetical protein